MAAAIKYSPADFHRSSAIIQFFIIANCILNAAQNMLQVQ